MFTENTVWNITKLDQMEKFGLSKKAAVVSNFCLIGKINHNFLLPRMIVSARQTFMPIQTLDLSTQSASLAGQEDSFTWVVLTSLFQWVDPKIIWNFGKWFPEIMIVIKSKCNPIQTSFMNTSLWGHSRVWWPSFTLLYLLEAGYLPGRVPLLSPVCFVTFAWI